MSIKNFFIRRKVKQYESSKNLFGTNCYIKAFGKNAKKSVEEAFIFLEKLHKMLSVFESDSEINNFNKAGNRKFKCSEVFVDILEKSRYYSDVTQGDFDITAQSLVNLWNVGKADFEVKKQDDIVNTLQYVDYKKIKIDKKNLMVSKEEKQTIGVGAIAKGYATDKVVEILIKYGVANAIINLGGNIFVMGHTEEDKAWTVGIQNPLKETGAYMGIIGLSNKSIVTSGSYERYSIIDDKIYSHIINLKTGFPLDNELLSITLITNKSLDGDGLSTGLFVKGSKEALNIIENLDGIEGICILKSKEVLLSSGLKKYFKIVDDEFCILE
ncbi:MAG: FAD:protein FMN transferase [Sarcina sp.]